MSQLKRELPDFDELVELADEDPEGLERLRESLVNDVIAQASPEQRHRLKGLQFTIDMERRRAKNPIQCCVRMSQMMHERVDTLRKTLNELADLTARLATTEAEDSGGTPVKKPTERHSLRDHTAQVITLFPGERGDEAGES